jgi:transcriptional regulator with XRE-family HTH domain
MNNEQEILSFSQWLNEPFNTSSQGGADWARAAKAARAERIESLCNALGVHRATIMNWVNQVTFPNKKERLEIAKIAGVAILFKVKETYYLTKPE